MNKKLRSAVCLLLLLGLLAALLLPVLAAETEETEAPREVLHITSEEDFLRFAKHCVRDIYSQDLLVSLDRDLHLKGLEFTGIPIFSGIFQGNHHTISGLSLAPEGSTQGLFRYLTEDAQVLDLILQGEILPEGSQDHIGGIAGSNAGLIRNCRFQGEASGTESVGGIAGINQVSGIIESCQVFGNVHGSHFIGGIAGENLGIIRSCKNRAGLNTQEEDNNIDSVSFTPEFFMGKESAETVTDIGGIAGSSTGVIRDCTNNGSVGYPRMGYNIGGIAGSQKGYITGCQNYGSIQGRKEVAGIAGQMEPVARITYTADTLQILRDQLATTSSLANQASSHIHSGAADIGSDVSQLHSQAEVAMDAISQLLPHGGFPDMDTVIAANNALSSSIGAMQGTTASLSGSVQSVVSTAAGDIQAIIRQVSAISHTLDTASENLGGEIVDVSDADTEEDYTGKVSVCQNYGPVEGDVNVGGIAGAVAWENDKDPEGDFEVDGDRSLNFDSQLRAVILRCSNSADITGKKRNIGGIAGDLDLGLVKDSISTGLLKTEDAQFVGGIAGISNGFIRSCSAKTQITGKSDLGGIAGQATFLKDCRAIAEIREGRSNLGSIAGSVVKGHEEQEESPVSGNFYLPLADHLGAVDGIDYYGVADSATKRQFKALEDLPEIFSRASMTFRYTDGTEETLEISLGEVVPAYKIPKIPQIDGFIGHWEGLEDIDLQNVFLDTTMELTYDPCLTVLESQQTRKDGKPVLLAEGEFSGEILLSAEPLTELPQGAEEGWTLPEFRDGKPVKIHLSVPDPMDAEKVILRVRRSDGSWDQVPTTADGSYVVFSLQPGDQAAVLQPAPMLTGSQIGMLAGASAAVLALAVFLILHIRRKKKAGK